MKQLALKTATITDRGEFTAIAAAYTVDRDNERIVPGAFAKSIAQWQSSGKMIPLHWNHSGAAEDIIGTVDPATMIETDAGLEVKGQLDLQENDVAREAWRLMKKNAVSLSFGYMPLKTAKASDGVVELKELDLFEITITPTPANPDTRFLGMKSQKEPSEATALRILNSIVGQCREYIAAEPDPADAEVMEEIITALAALTEEDRQDEAEVEDEGKKLTQADVGDTSEDGQKSAAIEDAHDEEPKRAKSRAQDALRKKGEELEFALRTAGVDLSQSPQVEAKPKHTPASAAELRKQSCDLTLELLTTGGISA